MNDIEDNLNWLKIGVLVKPKSETYALKEKCLFSENIGKTIRDWDNVKLVPELIGIVVGFRAIGPTCMVIVAFGGDLGGQKLALSENKLIKATLTPK